jgi:glycosyltransferase involved in cell wall biosynthesis
VRVLLVHGYYMQRGGEEEVFAAERALLENRGHEVSTFTVENERLVAMSGPRQAAATIWNRGAARDLREAIRAGRPDVAHFHNTFPLLSPAAHHAAAAEGVPVVQTLHNYRLLCPNALFFREGRVCEDCLGKAVPWPGVVHACYRGSRAASAVVAGMLTTHRAIGTWRRKVDRYIALTGAAREKYIAGGLPAERIRVKPNFVPDPGDRVGKREGFALFVGRLSPEKGIATLLDAWAELPGVPLRIVGGGPLREALDARVAAGPLRDSVELLGFRSQAEVQDLMKRADFLVFPSEWYEGAPRVVLEAFACGLPILGARLGALGELLDDRRMGIFFEPGDAKGLAAGAREMLADPARLDRMGREARSVYEARYTPERNYELLMEIYREVVR